MQYDQNGGLSLAGASLNTGGGLSYSAPSATFDPYTYGQPGGSSWLFYKPKVIEAAPPPASTPVGTTGGTGGSGGGAPYVETGNGPSGEAVGGYSSKGLMEGLATFGPNALGIASIGPLGLAALGYGIANNTESLGVKNAISGLFGGLFGNDAPFSFEGNAFSPSAPLGYDPAQIQAELDAAVAGYGDTGSGGGDASWGGGDNGMAGDPGSGTGDSGSAFGATGGLVTPQGIRQPLARGGLANGLIHGPGGGQDDKVMGSVTADSYIIPADVVSGLGDGNAIEGARRLPRAVGGLAQQSHGPSVPVAVSPAEAIIPPEAVARLGGGSIDRGEKVLDGFVRNVRKHKTGRGSKHPPKAHSPEKYLPGKR